MLEISVLLVGKVVALQLVQIPSSYINQNGISKIRKIFLMD